MQFDTWTKALAELPIDCVAVGVHDDGELTPEAKALDLRCREKLSRLMKRGDFSGKAGRNLAGHRSRRHPRRTRAAGGPGRQGPVFERRESRARPGAARSAPAIAAATRTRVTSLALALPRPAAKLLSDERLGRAVAELAGHTLYRVNDLKSGKKPRAHALTRVVVAATGQGGAGRQEGLRPGHGARRRRRADAQSRQPARQRLHAYLPRQDRRGPREDPQVAQGEGARPARDQAREDGLLPRGHAGQRRAAALHRHRTQAPRAPRARRWCWSARASPSTPAASRSRIRRPWTR